MFFRLKLTQKLGGAIMDISSVFWRDAGLIDPEKSSWKKLLSEGFFRRIDEVRKAYYYTDENKRLQRALSKEADTK